MNLNWKKRLTSLTVVLGLLNGIAASLQTYGVQELCGRSLALKSPTFGFESSASLKPTTSGPYRENLQCSLVVKRYSPEHDLVVSVRTLDFRPYLTDTLTIRYKDHEEKITVFSNSESFRKRNYDSQEKQSFQSSMDVTVTFKTSQGVWNTSLFEGFELIFTVVQHFPCNSSLYRCKSGVCTALELECDGHNHCGDRSDQGQHCEGPTTKSIVIIAVGVVVSVTFLALCLFSVKGLGIPCIKRRSATSTTYTEAEADALEITSVNSSPPRS